MNVLPIPISQRALDKGPASALEVVAGCIGCVGDAQFGSQILTQLNALFPIGWWSVYRLDAYRPPKLHVVGAHRIPDGTMQSWRAYADGLYRKDESFVEAREVLRCGTAALTHLQADEVAPDHREQIYSRHGIRERVSLSSEMSDGSLVSMNFYRHDTQPRFNDYEVMSLADMAPSLFACLKLHLQLSEQVGRVEALPSIRQPLDVLPRRERQVCERLLRGWTHEGVAADLEISAGTVKTYRDRAFERLGIHSRNELFALVASSANKANSVEGQPTAMSGRPSLN